MYTSIPLFLTEKDEPTERIRCPVHGFIHYSENEQAIIDHPVFQRLRNIRQLAFAHYIYPGAMHTRFEHSLGVMDLAARALDVLLRKHGPLLEETFKQLPAFRDQTIPKARQLIRLLGLLHDVGHTPFSHAGESIVPGGKHERVSAYVIRDGPLAAILGGCFPAFPELRDLLAVMIEEGDIPPQLRVLKQLVSGQMDLDRTDYLLRDSLHCGVGYGNFDYLRLIESLSVIQSRGAGLEVAIEPSGLHAFEALILARYQMNTQVYYHRLRRIYDLILQRYLQAWGKEHYDPVEKVLDYDDYSLLFEMRGDVLKDDGSERSKWAQRLLSRNHPKCIHESGDHADADDLETAGEIQTRLAAEFPNAELMLDRDAKGNVHKLFVPGEPEKVDDLFIVKGTYKERLTERSKIMEKVPKGFWVIRLFGYFADEAELERARARALEIHKSL